MRTKLVIGLFIAISMFSFNSCKNNKKVGILNRSKDIYVFIPILKIENKQLVCILDSVIANQQKCLNYKNKIFFTLHSNYQYRSIGKSQINLFNDHFVITNNGHYTNDSVSFKSTGNRYFGCFWYKTHLFYVFRFFKNSGWFSKTNKCLRYVMKKRIEESIYPPDFKESSQWFYRIQNGNIFFDEKYVICD